MDDLLKNYGENAVDDVTAPTVATAERSKPIVMKKLDITCAPDVELAQVRYNNHRIDRCHAAAKTEAIIRAC